LLRFPMGGKKKEIKMEKSELNELSTTILKELHAHYNFVPTDRVDAPANQTEVLGLLRRVFLLSQVLKWTGRKEHQKLEILELLDFIARQGQIAVINMGIDRDMNYDDLGFRCFLGEGTRYFEQHIYTPQVRVVRLYSDMPLRKAERAKYGAILEVKAEALKVWKKRDDFFEHRFRTDDLNLLFKRSKHEMIVKTIRENEKI